MVPSILALLFNLAIVSETRERWEVAKKDPFLTLPPTQ